MTDYIIIFYIADLISGITGICGVTGVILLILVSSWAFFCLLEDIDFLLKNKLLFLVGFLFAVICLFITVVLPSKTTVYMYAGAKAIDEQIELSKVTGTIQNEVSQLIMQKIKDEMKEDKE